METIRQLRMERGWTQEELAAKVGVTGLTVYNWERGQHMIPAPKLREVAAVFGVSMEVIDFESPFNERDKAGLRRRRTPSTPADDPA